MQIPLQITWRDVPQSEAIEADIRAKAEKLEHFCDRIISCRVVVEAPHAHHHKGKLYRLHIDLKVPGREIAVTRDPSEHQSHEDMYVAIRDAFDAAKRQLRDYLRVQRGDVKRREALHTARVMKRLVGQGYGFLMTPDGREIYFDRHSLVNLQFDNLDEGTEVHFVEEQGEHGPQARQITLAKHRGAT